MSRSPSPPSDDTRRPSLETTGALLQRLRNGDEGAATRFVERYAPFLNRVGRGRLPAWARSVSDTADIVQDTLIRTLRRIPTFEPKGDAAMRAYLRQTLINRVRDEVRRAEVLGPMQPPSTDLPGDATSPLARAISQEELARYERGLGLLKASERDAIIGRLELGYSYEQLAGVLNRPTPEAARLAVRRALLRLAEVMDTKPETK